MLRNAMGGVYGSAQIGITKEHGLTLLISVKRGVGGFQICRKKSVT